MEYTTIMLTRKKIYLHSKPETINIIIKKLKRVTFDERVRVYEIPSREYLMVENLINVIWYTPFEYELFIA